MISLTSHRITVAAGCAPFLFAAILFAAEPEMTGAFQPPTVKEDHFAALKESSPFTRSLNLSDSLILTGIENGEQIATLMNKETKETYVVSDQPNSQGWKMVEVTGNEELEKVSAKISVTGGQVVTVRYSEWQLKPGEAKPATGPGGEVQPGEHRGPGKGRGFGPPPEFREKMMKLSEEKRRKLFEYMMKTRSENPEMSREERGELMRKALDRLEKSN